MSLLINPGTQQGSSPHLNNKHWEMTHAVLYLDPHTSKATSICMRMASSTHPCYANMLGDEQQVQKEGGR